MISLNVGCNSGNISQILLFASLDSISKYTQHSVMRKPKLELYKAYHSLDLRHTDFMIKPDLS